jgi:hypothetical protein
MISGFELSQHAQYQMQERNIHASWVTDALSEPDKILPLADGQGNKHYLRCIPEFGNRWLRIIVNPNVEPKRIVTLFFDRRLK